MDGSAFDRLTRTFTEPRSRRGVHRLVGGLAVGGPLALAGAAESTAKKKRKPCPPCKKRKKGKCKARLPEGTSCIDKAGQGGTCQGGSCVAAADLPLTCSDGIKNGNESDIDCGGSCGRCQITGGCTGPNDCASAYCVSGTCASCPPGGTCGTDGGSTCVCQPRASSSEQVCVNFERPQVPCGAGGSCPSNTVCVQNGSFMHVCLTRCGAP
jgi:hypothetical protein